MRPRQLAREITDGWEWAPVDRAVTDRPVLVRALRVVLASASADLDALATRVQLHLTMLTKNGREGRGVESVAVLFDEQLADFPPEYATPTRRKILLLVPFVIAPRWRLQAKLSPQDGCACTFEREEAPVSTEFVLRWYASIVGDGGLAEDAPDIGAADTRGEAG